MLVNAYIDGFNLYYGAVRWTTYKWLDLRALCEAVLPGHTIRRIRYFTARISSPDEDPGKVLRQQVFIRALQTLPGMVVHYGHYATHKVSRRLVTPLADGADTVQVYDPKEKGSDVNLASYLLADAFLKEYEMALVVSNDSDLTTPIQLVRRILHLNVAVLSPQWRRPRPDGTTYRPSHSKALSSEATQFLVVTEKLLARCQFSPVLHDRHGTITKPAEW